MNHNTAVVIVESPRNVSVNEHMLTLVAIFLVRHDNRFLFKQSRSRLSFSDTRVRLYEMALSRTPPCFVVSRR